MLWLRRSLRRQYSVASLLLAVTFAACFVAFVSNRLHSAQREKEFVTKAKQTNAYAITLYEYPMSLDRISVNLVDPKFRRVESVCALTKVIEPFYAKQIRNLDFVREWRLNSVELNANLVMELSRLPRLEILRLNGTNADDAMVAQLARNATLREVSLNNTLVTDASLSCLRECPSLKYLSVRNTRMTKTSIEEFCYRRVDVVVRH